MKPVLLAVLLLWPQIGAASETWLTASLGSYHFQRGQGYCEVNPGTGYERGERLRFVAGVFQNSNCRTSTYIGLSYSFVQWGSFSLGGALAAFTGYDKVSKEKQREDKVIFAPLPVVSYEASRWGLNLIVLPPHDDFKGGVGVQVKWRF